MGSLGVYRQPVFVLPSLLHMALMVPAATTNQVSTLLVMYRLFY